MGVGTAGAFLSFGFSSFCLADAAVVNCWQLSDLTVGLSSGRGGFLSPFPPLVGGGGATRFGVIFGDISSAKCSLI